MFHRVSDLIKAAAMALCLALPHVPIAAAAQPVVVEAPKPVPPGLVDQNGEPFDGGRQAGSVRIVYFGYTNCPDVCPTTLSDISLALFSLKPDLRADLQPIFVTGDPRRDTPPVLKAYLNAFGDAFIGVSGPVAAIDAYAWNNGAYVLRNDGSDTVSYTVDHTSSVFLLDSNDAVIDRIEYGAPVPEIANRLQAAVLARRTKTR